MNNPIDPAVRPKGPQPTILYEDPHLLVLNKPAQLLTQAPPGIPSAEAWAKAYLKEKYQKPAGVYLAVPHRLDRPVTGVLCFVRNTKAAQRIHAQFQNRTVRKVYRAWVWGTPLGDIWADSLDDPPQQTWEDWLKKLPDEARTLRCAGPEPGAKLARLVARQLGTMQGPAGRATLLELEPSTGRSHQLRVQCATRNAPIWGDYLYGGAVAPGLPDGCIGLHASRLELTHPFTQARLSWTAPEPAYWPAATVNPEGAIHPTPQSPHTSPTINPAEPTRRDASDASDQPQTTHGGDHRGEFGSA